MQDPQETRRAVTLREVSRQGPDVHSDVDGCASESVELSARPRLVNLLQCSDPVRRSGQYSPTECDPTVLTAHRTLPCVGN